MLLAIPSKKGWIHYHATSLTYHVCALTLDNSVAEIYTRIGRVNSPLLFDLPPRYLGEAKSPFHDL
jgi:hypothetical protein